MSYLNRLDLRPRHLLKVASFAAALALVPACTWAPYDIHSTKEIEGCVKSKSPEPSKGAIPDKLIIEMSTDDYGPKKIIVAGIEEVLEADSTYREGDKVKITIEQRDLTLLFTNFDERQKRVKERSERSASNKVYALGGSRESLVRMELLRSSASSCTG